MTNILNYQHFPVYSVMVLFLGAFLIVMFGKYKTFRNISGVPRSVNISCMYGVSRQARHARGRDNQLLDGRRSMAGGYAIGIAMEVDALSLFFGLLISTAVFVSCVYSFKYMSHDDNVPQYYTLFSHARRRRYGSCPLG